MPVRGAESPVGCISGGELTGAAEEREGAREGGGERGREKFPDRDPGAVLRLSGCFCSCPASPLSLSPSLKRERKNKTELKAI